MDLRTLDCEERRREMRFERAARLGARGRSLGGIVAGDYCGCGQGL